MTDSDSFMKYLRFICIFIENYVRIILKIS